MIRKTMLAALMVVAVISVPAAFAATSQNAVNQLQNDVNNNRNGMSDSELQRFYERLDDYRADTTNNNLLRQLDNIEGILQSIGPRVAAEDTPHTHDELENSVSQNTAAISDLDSDIVALDGEFDAYEIFMNAIIGAINTSMGILEDNIQTNADDIDSLETDIATLDSELEQGLLDVNRRISPLDTSLSNLENTVDGLDGDISDLENDVSQHDSDISGLKSDVSGLQSDVNNNTNEINRLDGLLTYVDNIATSIDAYARSQIDTINTSVTSLTDRMSTVENNLSANVDQTRDNSIAITELETHSHDEIGEHSHSDLLATITELEGRITDLEAEPVSTPLLEIDTVKEENTGLYKTIIISWSGIDESTVTMINLVKHDITSQGTPLHAEEFEFDVSETGTGVYTIDASSWQVTTFHIGVELTLPDYTPIAQAGGTFD